MHGSATPLHDPLATPSHALSDDDVWRPGDIDKSPMKEEQEEGNGGGWGSTLSSSNAADPFSNVSSSGENNANNSGWGTPASSDQPNTWTPTTDPSPSPMSYGGDSTPISTPNNDTYSNDDASSSDRDMESNGNGSTSMDNDDDTGDPAEWFMERVCVQLKKDSSMGIIREINMDQTGVLEVSPDQPTITVRASEVVRVEPREHDMVLVTAGADVGVEGELVCIDGQDAILKDANEEFKIVDFVHLAKIERDS